MEHNPHQEPMRATQYFPAYWTPTDQVIMEDLLLQHHADTSDAAETAAYHHHLQLKSAHVDTESGSDSGASVQRSHVKRRTVSSSSSPSSSGSAATSPSCEHTRTNPASTNTHTHGESRPAKVSDEERRARHRAVQKRFVQRKKEAIKQTKKLAAALEQQYQFLQVSSETRFLQKENAALQAQHAAIGRGALSQGPKNPHALLEEQLELVREFYAPLTHEDWTCRMRKNLEEYEVASQDQSYLTSGLTVMGWRDQRKIDNSSVKFVLSKEFPNIRAVELMEKTWRLLSSPETHACFFSPVFTVKVQILQVINENALVIHRALYNPQSGGIAHALDLLCRVRRGDDFIIFESAIENNAVHACLVESHKWTQMTVSQVFSPSASAASDLYGGHGCVFRHGGWLRHFVASNVKYWLMEMFFMTLRYESRMVSPIFCLTSEDTTTTFFDSGTECQDFAAEVEKESCWESPR